MAIENSVSNDFLSMFVNSINVFECRLSSVRRHFYFWRETCSFSGSRNTVFNAQAGIELFVGYNETFLSNQVQTTFIMEANGSDCLVWAQIVCNYQVWGILETRDQNYSSNARPRLRLADLLTEVVILQLRRRSER